MTEFGPVVMIVQDSITGAPLFSALPHVSHSPAKASGRSSGCRNRNGCLTLPSVCHSKKPLAGIMHRRRLKAERNDGFSATVSALALLSIGAFLGSFTQAGNSPQRIRDICRCP